MMDTKANSSLKLMRMAFILIPRADKLNDLGQGTCWVIHAHLRFAKTIALPTRNLSKVG